MKIKLNPYIIAIATVSILVNIYFISAQFSQEENFQLTNNQIISNTIMSQSGAGMADNSLVNTEAPVTVIDIVKRSQYSQTMGNNLDTIVENYYDSENEEFIEAWVGDELNRDVSKTGDMLDFLFHCEKLKKTNQSKREIKVVFNELVGNDMIKLIDQNKDLQIFFIKNSSSHKNGKEYKNDYTTSLIRAFFQENNRNIEELIDGPDAYIFNEIYSFLDDEISEESYKKVSNQVIDMGIQGSKLYTGLYLDYLTNASPLSCKDVLKQYGADPFEK